VVIHDSGLIRFGHKAHFEAGLHQGLTVTPAAIQEFCAALS
jgi:hypothetical protein